MRKRLASIAACATLGIACTQAQATGLDLGNYYVAGAHTLTSLPYTNTELSAITWSADTNRLYAVEDEGKYIYELGLDGSLISSMSLGGFADTESLTYIGGGQFVIGEERIQELYRFTYTAGGSMNRFAMTGVPVGPDNVGNEGLEGVAWDPLHNSFLLVKEKNPKQLREATVDFDTHQLISSLNLTVPNAPLGGALQDLSDVASLAAVASLVGTADQDNLLLLSQESQLLLEISRSGQVLSFFDLTSLGTRIEGVAVAGDGTIYLTNEGIIPGDGPVTPAQLFALKPTAVPLPAGAWLLVSGLCAIGAAGRRKAARAISAV